MNLASILIILSALDVCQSRSHGNSKRQVANETTIISVDSISHEINTSHNCTKKQQILRRQRCFVPLIHWLQKNPNKNCSVEHEIFADCLATIESSCYGYPKNQIKKAIILHYNKERVCDGVWFHLPANRSYEKFPGFSCRKTKEKIEKVRVEQNNCGKDFEAMWSKNRGNGKMCGAYSSVKSCMKNLINKAGCNKTQDEKTTIDAQLSDFNPYCPNGVDESTRIDDNNASILNNPSSLMCCTLFIIALFVDRLS